MAQKLAIAFSQNVDLVDLQSAYTVLRQQIISTGKAIYITDPKELEEFESRVLSDYVRLNESRRGILKDIQDKGHVYAR